jgi:hypothetical protein
LALEQLIVVSTCRVLQHCCLLPKKFWQKKKTEKKQNSDYTAASLAKKKSNEPNFRKEKKWHAHKKKNVI